MKKLHDRFFRRAKEEGYAARSIYKLEEIDRRRRLLRPGQRVLDLGCAPGSWLQYAAHRVGHTGVVVGVDPQPVPAALPGHVRVVVGDAFSVEPASLLHEGQPFDVVLSDMAPATSGIKSADAARSAELVRRALALCEAVLRPGGALLAKVFQGAEMSELRGEFKRRFHGVWIEKPRASRAESVELFLLGQERRA